MNDRELEFLRRQYDLLAQEQLEIHSRTDRFEQFFVLVIGGIYGFAFTKFSSLENMIFIVPPVIAFFVFMRLELLSHVRSIIREKLLEIEESLMPEGGIGMYQHSQSKFYGIDTVELGAGWSFKKLLTERASDRGKFWKVAFWLMTGGAIIANWSSFVEQICGVLPA